MLPNEYEADPQCQLLAKRLACKRARQWGMLYLLDDMIGVAYAALVTAARTYDASHGASFKTRLFSVVNRALMDFGRKERPKGFRRISQIQKRQDNRQMHCKVVSIEDYEEQKNHRLRHIGESLTSQELPVGWEIESLDEVEGLIRRLHHRRAELLRQRFTRAGMKFKRMAVEMGYSEGLLFQWQRESLKRLRKEIEEPS